MQSKIARLFYLTHSDKELHELVAMFATFKQQQIAKRQTHNGKQR